LNRLESCLLGGVLSASLWSAALSSHAAPNVPVDPSLGEAVVLIGNGRFLPVDLETTVFRPPGDGPSPVVVINHGKESGNNRFQGRYRPIPAVREFLKRGYVIVVPMRQGFSNSGGRAVGEGCNIAGNGSAQAGDVAAVVAWVVRQPWADAQRMVMLGQSHGGLTTLAYARDPDPGFKLFVNFAGGLKWADGGCNWQREMVSAFSSYGGATHVPSLWFYGGNDSYFPPDVIAPAHAAYVAAGGAAELVAYGPFGNDAHGMFGSTAGLPIWWPKVEAKLSVLGMPTAVVNPQFAPRRVAPAASGASP
jgi:dienelactone hydrolase